jgi:putative endonuclease
MYYVYILYSDCIGEYYCGQTNNVESRLIRHNSGETQSIKHGIPWKLIGYLKIATRKESMQLDKQIKKRGIRRWLSVNMNKLFSPVKLYV